MTSNGPRNHRDLGAKRILSALGQQLAVAITGHPDTRFIRVETRELQIKQRTPDLEMHLEHPEIGKVIAIVEIQGKADPEFPRRLAALTTWLAHDRGCPVIPVVIYLGQPGYRCSAHYHYELAGARIEVRPVEIVLSEQDAREVVETGMDGPWWPFIPFMRHGDDPEILVRLVEKINARPDLEQVAEDMLRMVAHVVDLSQVRFFLEGRGMFDIWELDPKVGSSNWKLLVAKAEAMSQELVSRAAQEGLAEGREQGSRQEALRMVRRAIARRFGMPDPDLSHRLEKLHTEQLEALNESLFDLAAPADLKAWLDRET